MDKEDWLEGQQNWVRAGEAAWAAHEYQSSENAHEMLGEAKVTRASQRKLLQDYVKQDRPFVNRVLRFQGGDQLELEDTVGGSEHLAQEVKNIRSFDKLFANQPPTREPFVAFRGTGRNRVGDLQPGRVFSDRAFMSVTTDKDMANEYPFNFSTRQQHGIVLEIHVPRGAKAISIANTVDKKFESEILLPRSSHLLIHSVEGNKVVAELLLPHPKSSMEAGGPPPIEPVQFKGNDVFNSAGDLIGHVDKTSDTGFTPIYHGQEGGKTNLGVVSSFNEAANLIGHFSIIDTLMGDAHEMHQFPEKGLGDIAQVLMNTLTAMSKGNSDVVPEFLDNASRLAKDGHNFGLAFRIEAVRTSMEAGGSEPVAKKPPEVDEVTAAHRNAVASARAKFHEAVNPLDQAVSEAFNAFTPEYDRIIAPAQEKIKPLQSAEMLNRRALNEANRQEAAARRKLRDNIDPSQGALLAAELSDIQALQAKLESERRTNDKKQRAAYKELRRAEDKAQEQRDLALQEPRAMLAAVTREANKALDQDLLAARVEAFRARGGTGKYSLGAELEQRRAALDKTLKSQHLSTSDTRQGRIGDTTIDRFANGGRAVIKVQASELNDREEAGLAVAHALGIADAPVFQRLAPDTIALEFVDGETGVTASGVQNLGESIQGQKIGFLDQIIGNSDRNPGNYIKSAVTGEAAPIDHGYSFDSFFLSRPGTDVGHHQSPFPKSFGVHALDPAFDKAQFDEWRTELNKLEDFFDKFEASLIDPHGDVIAHSGADWFSRMMEEFEHWADIVDFPQNRAWQREVEAQANFRLL